MGILKYKIEKRVEKKINVEEMEEKLAETWKSFEKDYSKKGWGDGDESPIKKETFDITATLIRSIQLNLKKEGIDIPNFLILPCANGDIDINFENWNADLLICVSSTEFEKHDYYGTNINNSLKTIGSSSELDKIVEDCLPIIREMKKLDFEHPYVTVDAILFTIKDEKLKVMLVKREKDPFKDEYALAGAFVNVKESLDRAVKRVLKQKAGLDKIYMEQLYTFGGLTRDPRGRIISVAYFALVNHDEIEKCNEMKGKWFDVRGIHELPFHHHEIIKVADERLKGKVTYTTIISSLLPEKFTINQLRKAYEIILDRKLYKGNFHSKMLRLGILEDTGEMEDKSVGHRPARYYRFTVKPTQIIEIF